MCNCRSNTDCRVNIYKIKHPYIFYIYVYIFIYKYSIIRGAVSRWGMICPPPPDFKIQGDHLWFDTPSPLLPQHLF